MAILLLAVVYLSFIGLGLPNAVLGAAWPRMQPELGAPISAAGIILMIISCATVAASLLSARLVARFKTAIVTAGATALSAGALLGFSFVHSFAALCMWAVPYGLGSGLVNAALNNFVAAHYSARYMNWSHCAWGIGATIGSYGMGMYLTHGLHWHAGYRMLSVTQWTLAALTIVSLPLWNYTRERQTADTAETEPHRATSFRTIRSLRGIVPVLVSFLFCCAFEAVTGLWGAVYMTSQKNITPETAARFTALLFFGITAGRFISGFLSLRFTNKQIVRIGVVCASLGIFTLFVSWVPALTAAGFIIIGMGSAPLYPSLLHETPRRFGTATAHSVIGVQMAATYVGTTALPPAVGLALARFGAALYPALLIGVLLVFFVSNEWATQVIDNKKNNRMKNKAE